MKKSLSLLCIVSMAGGIIFATGNAQADSWSLTSASIANMAYTIDGGDAIDGGENGIVDLRFYNTWSESYAYVDAAGTVHDDWQSGTYSLAFADAGNFFGDTYASGTASTSSRLGNWASAYSSAEDSEAYSHAQAVEHISIEGYGAVTFQAEWSSAYTWVSNDMLGDYADGWASASIQVLDSTDQWVNVAATSVFEWASDGSSATDDANGVLYASIFVDGVTDLRFFVEAESYVSDGAPAPVPEPATMLLFGTGLAGLAGAARRKKAQKK